ncbi:MAG: polysaccharide biosynthesis/export family protein [Stellaceae bacterium]
MIEAPARGLSLGSSLGSSRKSMKRAWGIVVAAALTACSFAPGSGPRSADAVAGGGKANGAILYDVVKVDNRVVAAVLARPHPSFRALFAQGQPPPPRIAAGDRIAVVIWEAGPGGLFTAPLPALPAAAPPNPTIEPLETPQSPLPASPGRAELNRLLGLPPGGETPPGEATPQTGEKPPAAQAVPPSVRAMLSAASANRTEAARLARQNRMGTAMPVQQVARDGMITIPYAGRIAAAGHTAAEVQREITARLAKKALEPQVLVVDQGGPAHAVTVTGAVVHGARIPLSPAGDRLLQVIAEAGGARAPVRDLFIRLSRGGRTATLPLAALVAHSAQNIYAWPGDALTLIRRPQTFSVFGAANRANHNAQIRFDAATLTLGEALGKARGLRPDIANARGVFLFRHESDAVLRALGEPLAADARGGVSPVVYRFDLSKPKDFFLARRFPVRDKDIIFVVDAGIMPLYRWFRVLNKIIGPVEEGFIVCYTTAGC